MWIWSICNALLKTYSCIHILYQSVVEGHRTKRRRKCTGHYKAFTSFKCTFASNITNNRCTECMDLPISSAKMILVSLEGCVERACRTALREQPLLSSSTGWILATSGLVEDLNIPVRKTGNAQKQYWHFATWYLNIQMKGNQTKEHDMAAPTPTLVKTHYSVQCSQPWAPWNMTLTICSSLQWSPMWS